MDRLDAIRLFVRVAETGSFSAVAREANVGQPAVSKQVAALERRLGAQLMHRTSRSLTLTEAGQVFYEAAIRLLGDLDAARAQVGAGRSRPSGLLRVSLSAGFGRLHVVPLLAEFFAAYPDIDVRLVLADRVVSLIEDHIDVALRVGTLPDSSLIALRAGTVRRVTCASPDYLKVHGTPHTPEDLAGHDCISFAGFIAPDAWSFVREDTTLTVPVHSRLVVSNVEAACDAARVGIGITGAFDYHIAAARKAGTLTTILDEFQPPAVPVNLVYTAGRFLPLKLRAFLDFAAPRLKARLME